MAEPAMDEAIDIETELQACSICGRTFLPLPLVKHFRVCEKNATKKRKIFDSLKQRVEGTDLALFHQKRYLKRQDSVGTIQLEVKQNNWKEKHIELVNAIRAAKGVSTTMSPVQKKSSSVLNVGNERCPSCDRQFGPKAYDRHVEWCKEKKSRIQQSPVNVLLAKERLEARTKYRVPPLNKPKRLTTKEKYLPIATRNDITTYSSKSAANIQLERTPSVKKPKSIVNLSKSLKETPNHVKHEKIDNHKKEIEKLNPKETKNKTNHTRTKLPKINTIDVNKDCEGMQVKKILSSNDGIKLITWKDTIKNTNSTPNCSNSSSSPTLTLIKINDNNNNNKKNLKSELKKLNVVNFNTGILSNSRENLGNVNRDEEELIETNNNKKKNKLNNSNKSVLNDTIEMKSDDKVQNKKKTCKGPETREHTKKPPVNTHLRIKSNLYLPCEGLIDCHKDIKLIELHKKPYKNDNVEICLTTLGKDTAISLNKNSLHTNQLLSQYSEEKLFDTEKEGKSEIISCTTLRDKAIVGETKKLLDATTLEPLVFYSTIAKGSPQRSSAFSPTKYLEETNISEDELLYSKLATETYELESLDGQVVNKYNDALSSARSEIYTRIRKCHSDICLKKKSDVNLLTSTELDLSKFQFNYEDDLSVVNEIYNNQQLLDITSRDFNDSFNSKEIPHYTIDFNSIDWADFVPRKKRKLNDRTEEMIYVRDELSHEFMNTDNEDIHDSSSIVSDRNSNDVSVIPLDAMINLLGICDKPTNNYLPVIQEASNECTSVNDSCTTLYQQPQKTTEPYCNSFPLKSLDDAPSYTRPSPDDGYLVRQLKSEAEKDILCNLTTTQNASGDNIKTIMPLSIKRENLYKNGLNSAKKYDRNEKELKIHDIDNVKEKLPFNSSTETNTTKQLQNIIMNKVDMELNKKKEKCCCEDIKDKWKNCDTLKVTNFQKTLDITNTEFTISRSETNFISMSANEDSDIVERKSQSEESENAVDILSPRTYKLLYEVFSDEGNNLTTNAKLLYVTRSQVINLLKLNYKKISQLIATNSFNSTKYHDQNVEDHVKFPLIPLQSSNQISERKNLDSDKLKLPLIANYHNPNNYSNNQLGIAMTGELEKKTKETLDLHNSLPSKKNVDYNPFVSAERQLMELLECDDFKPFQIKTQKLPSRPQTTDNTTQRPKSPQINKNKKITTKSADNSHKINLTKITSKGKRASVIDPPADFQDKSINDSFEMLENYINKTFGNEEIDFDNFIKDNRKEINGFFLDNKENDKYSLSAILNDSNSIDPRLINENDDLTIPDNFKSNNSTPISDINDIDHYSVQYDQKISVLEADDNNYVNDSHLQTDDIENLISSLDDLQNFSRTPAKKTNKKLTKSSINNNKKAQKSTLSLNSSFGGNNNDKMKNLSSLKRSISLLDPVLKPKSLKNKKDVENYFEEHEHRNNKKELQKQQSAIEETLKNQPKAEELFAVDDEMYEEYKKYEEMYLKEKEEKLKKEERKLNETPSDDEENQQHPPTNKLSGDSAYGSLNRKSTKIRSRAHKLSPLGINKKNTTNTCAESPSSSSSESSPALSSSTPIITIDQKRMSKFCHECGNKYPVNTAKFCVECGVKRLLL